MRYLLILVLLWGSLTLSGTTFYIDPSGNNSNNGSSGSPWKTLAYACSKVSVSGDIIHVNAGVYAETTQSVLAPGVSIEGVGVTSIIKSNVSGTSTILLNSTSQGTDGNQHISNIKMDGDGLIGYVALQIAGRRNVSIHDCTIINFGHEGVIFTGGAWGSNDALSIYATNNSFYNNTITNCAGYSSGIGGYGNLHVSGQQDMLIHDNTITATGRAQGNNGVCIKSVNENGNTKGLKIYNNILITDQTWGDDNSNSYKFAIELWDGQGTEIYNNNIYGTIDIGGYNRTKGIYNYSISVHNNFIGSANSTPVYLIGFVLEPTITCDEVLIYNNTVKNVSQGIVFFPLNNAKYSNVKVYYNIFDQIGRDQTGWTPSPAYGFSSGSGTASSITNFYFYNNVFNMSTYSGALQASAIEIPCKAGVKVDYFYIQNNIIIGCDAPAITSKTAGTIDHLSITNNIIYASVNNNDPSLSITPTNYTNSNNLKSNPLFVSSSDFRLQTGSPAIGKGLTISGATVDFANNPLKSPPSIGAYESGSSTATSTVPVYQNSTVENATPSLLTMTYNTSLANIVPAATSFTSMVNSVKRVINSVAISGSSVQLTLASPVLNGEVVTIAYTLPSGNPLQSVSGGQAATIIAQPVTNNVNGINPVYVSSSVENATPSILAMSFGATLANIVPAASSFSVLVNSTTRAISSVLVTGSKVQLTLASKIVAGDIVKVSYTKPSGSPLQTASGLTASSISNQPVNNNCLNNAPTALITSPVSSSTFAALSNVSITANALDSDGSISLVEFYSGSTKLGSTAVAPYTFVWSNVTSGNYILTAVATDNLNAKTTSPAISISVTSKNPNKKPVIRISNPRKGNTYAKLSSISIDAIASDSDGTISKVELFNGPIKLIEMTTAPYTFTWKDVAAGNYKITAIATDNMNDTTISSPVEFIVGTTVKYDANSDIVKLYPNPNNGHFSIEFINPIQSERSEIIITDLAGKQVYNGPLLKEETLKKFDLSDSRSGVYVMMIKDKDIYVTKKFIKN